MNTPTFQIFQKTLDAFKEARGAKRWLEDFWKKPSHHQRKDGPPLYVLAMAAHYSPNLKSQEMGVDLPFDLNNGEMFQNVWNRWLSWDPTRMVEKYINNLKKLNLIYIDCGTSSETLNKAKVKARDALT